jgi:hypothetical protein
MRAPLPSLSDAQQQRVLAALATLRLSAHDRFLLELASALARSPHHPVTDLDLKVAIRGLLGVMPPADLVHERRHAER